MGVKRGSRRVGLISAVVCLLLPAAAQATTFDVTTTADSGDGSLRQAIVDANATEGSDDIDATGVTGTINLQSALPTLSEDVDIAGPGSDQLAVRRNAGGEYRIFDIAQAVETTLSGLTIANGDVSGNGGGIFNFGRLTLQDAVVTGNHADGSGGGVYTHADIDFDGELTAQNSVIDENDADGDGGGLYTLVGQSGILRIDGSEVSGNSAGGSGGGIRLEFPGSVRAEDSTIADNTAAAGGGVSGITTLVGSTVRGNSATAGSGGGISAFIGMTIEESVITQNTATTDGGGVYAADMTDGRITSSEVSDNSAGGVDPTATGAVSWLRISRGFRTRPSPRTPQPGTVVGSGPGPTNSLSRTAQSRATRPTADRTSFTRFQG